jgi:hypothetical protein
MSRGGDDSGSVPKVGSLLRREIKTKVTKKSAEEQEQERARKAGRDEAKNWETEDLVEERINLFTSQELHYPLSKQEVSFLREKLGEKILLLGRSTEGMMTASDSFGGSSIHAGNELQRRYFKASLLYLREFLLATWSKKEGRNILAGREHIKLIAEDETVAERVMLDVMRTVTEETLLHPPSDKRAAQARDDLINGLGVLQELLAQR